MDALELTKELVNIPSETVRDGEKNVGRYIKDYIHRLGVEAELVEFAPNRANVIASIGKGEGLMLNGHMDTVPAGDKSQWEFGPNAVEHSGKLYGRGTSDMKAGIACILAALSKSNLKNPKRRILLAFVAGEETGFDGSNYLLDHRQSIFQGVKYGVIGEPTDLKIQIAQKGVTDTVITFKGKGAHGSKPWLGDNAILKATRFIDELMKLSNTFSIEDPILGKGTINIGKISGGTAINVVPDSCSIEIDRRMVPGESKELVLRQYKSVLKKLRINDAVVDMKFGRNAFSLDEKSKIVQMVKAVSSAKISEGATGYTEAELYKAKANIDSVVFGPGTKEIIHQPNEYIPIANIAKATTVFEKLIKRWIG